jgi:pimeloyl-ACP methyl ester carboxylesterase
MDTIAARTGYAPVNGLQMYYELHGDGPPPPLVLLHGGISGIGTSFGGLLPALSRGRRVIAAEFQGHARTADIDRPLTVPNLASDVIALLAHLDVPQADLFGYSTGAAVALEVALQRPGLARKLVLVSLATREAGEHPGLRAGMDSLQPEMLAGSPFYEEYARLAPRPGDWPRLIEKIKAFSRSVTDWPDDALRSLQAPALIVIGDSDIVRPEHAVEVFRLLGGGVMGDVAGLPQSRLAILPGSTHITVMHRAEWITAMVNDFLG